MRKALRTSPKVRRMARQLGIEPAHVRGLLLDFWMWADEAASDDGLLPGLEPADVDDELGFAGFADAMLEASWLALEDDGLSIPEFDSYLGEKHRKRVKERQKKQRYRARKATSVSPVDTPECPPGTDRHVPGGQSPPVPGGLSTECPRNVPPSQPSSTSQNPSGSSRGTRGARPDWRTDLEATEFAGLRHHPGFVEAWERWVDYRREARLVTWKPVTYRAMWRKGKKFGAAALVEAIDQAISVGWAGLFPQKASQGSPTAPSARSSGMNAADAAEAWRSQQRAARAASEPRDVEAEAAGSLRLLGEAQ